MMKKSIKGVIFDFDGVLVDSEDFYQSLWSDFFSEQNLDQKSSSLGYTFEEYLKVMGMSNAREEVYKTRIVKERVFFNSAPINQYFKSFIFEKEKDLKFVIGSNNSYELIRKFLVHNSLDGIIRDVITPDCGYKPKPNPDIFNECVRRMDLPRDCVLVIEDSQIGIMAADSAGLESLVIPFPKVKGEIDVLTDYLD